MNRFYKALFLFLLLVSIVFSNEKSEIKLDGKNKPATLKIGVTKIKTEDINLELDLKNNVVFGEIQNIGDNLVYISETLDEIPSLVTKKGKRTIFNLKKNLKSLNAKFNYEIINVDDRQYIKIRCNEKLENIYIYIVEKGSYRLKKVYKGILKSGLEVNIPKMTGTFKFLEEKAAYFKFGTYEIKSGQIYMGETGEIVDFAILEGDYPEKNIPSSYYGLPTNVFLSNPNGDSTKVSFNQNSGIFSGDLVIGTSKSKTGAKIRVFTNAQTSHISWQLLEWDGGKIFEQVEIKYTAWAWNEEKRKDYLKIYLPEAKLLEAPINIQNPIVMFDVDNYDLGRVLINSSGSKTLSSTGGEFTKNGKWIDATGPNYPWQALGKHRVVMTLGSGKSESTSMSNGGTFETYLGMGDNSILSTYEGGGDEFSFGVAKYDFNGSEDTLEILHYHPTVTNFIANRFIYRVKFPKFDAHAYYDNTKDIKTTTDFIKQYEVLTQEHIELGSVGLKDLDIRITHQSGGTGIKIRVEEDVVLKNIDNPDYPLIPAKLYLQGGELVGENEKAKETKVYLVIPQQERLVGGGKFKITKLDGNSPLEIGVEVNGDKSTHFKSITDLYLEVSKRFAETNIDLNNERIPLIESQNKGWIIFNKTNYPNGILTGYDNEKFGNISGDVIDIPLNSKVEVLDESYKKLADLNSGVTSTDIPIGSESKLTLFYGGQNFLKVGVKSGNYKAEDKGIFYLRYKDSDGKYLFIQKFNISFKQSLFQGNTIFTFKNPMVKALPTLGNLQGVVIFNASDFDSSPNQVENNNWTKEDSMKWWNIHGAVDYPKYKDAPGYTYEFLSSTGSKLAEITPTGIGHPQKIITLQNGVTLKIGISNYEEGYGKKAALALGIIDGYDGKKKEETIYVVLKDENGTVVKYDKLAIVLEEFDPRYYGSVYPSSEDNKYGKVGEGVEKLKDVTGNTLIDLGTDFRFYMRYLNILDIITNNHTKEISVIAPESVEIKRVGNPNLSIIGKLKFVSIADGTILDSVIINENQIDRYLLKIELTPDEYRKLEANQKYEVYSNGSKDILKIGLNRETQTSPWVRYLPLDKPLNFTVTPETFEIFTNNLDFGKINIHSQINKVQGETTITVKGNSVNEFLLTPSVSKTNIYMINSDGSLDTSKSLEVKELNTNEVLHETVGENYKTRVYKMTGVLNIDPATVEVGNYENTIEVTATVIF